MDQKSCFKNKRTLLTRRDFFRILQLAAAGALSARCQTATLQTLAASASPAPIETSLPGKVQVSHLVSIAKSASYEPDLIRKQVISLMDGLGGLGDVIRPGDRVTIKINLTSGSFLRAPEGFTEIESYMTHPEVVRALGEVVRDAGAGKVSLVESVYDPGSFARYGYEQVAKSLNADLIDLNSPSPYEDFVTLPVGKDWLVYDTFSCHRILQETDVFISAAKMKCHFNCGITLSMKNLIGLLPVSRYRQCTDHWWRSALHGNGDEANTRLPRIIIDLNRARPIHLALIDGIKTAEGGEVPRGTFKPSQPGVLVAGKNSVATDAISSEIMSFDPTIEPPSPPFLRCDNYLNLARRLGLGSNQVNEIQVAGVPIDEVRVKFDPAWKMG